MRLPAMSSVAHRLRAPQATDRQDRPGPGRRRVKAQQLEVDHRLAVMTEVRGARPETSRRVRLVGCESEQQAGVVRKDVKARLLLLPLFPKLTPGHFSLAHAGSHHCRSHRLCMHADHTVPLPAMAASDPNSTRSTRCPRAERTCCLPARGEAAGGKPDALGLATRAAKRRAVARPRGIEPLTLRSEALVDDRVGAGSGVLSRVRRRSEAGSSDCLLGSCVCRSATAGTGSRADLTSGSALDGRPEPANARPQTHRQVRQEGVPTTAA